MDHFTYSPDPMVCSSKIELEIENGLIRKALFTGGCHGNLQAVNQLVKNRTPEEVIALLKGIRCGGKPTSCPDQLAIALQTYLNKRNQK